MAVRQSVSPLDRLATDENALATERRDRPHNATAKGQLSMETRVLSTDVRKKRQVDVRRARVTDHKFISPDDEVAA